MKKRILSITLIGFTLFAVLVAGILFLTQNQSIDLQALNSANQLYTAGHFTEGAAIYEQLIAQGGRDSALYYNLGNSYYQQGDLGRAILNYQRAAQLAPRDRDIQANLSLARAQVVEAYPEVPAGPFDSLAKITSGWLTLNETAIIALLLWFAFGFLVLTWRLQQPGRLENSLRTIALVLLLFVVVASLSLGSRMLSEYNQSDGIIVAPTVTVSSSPNEQHPTDFQLHSGVEVNLLETNGDWIRISVPGEVVEGWLPLETVEQITQSPQFSRIKL
jgi:hypothetical protein